MRRRHKTSDVKEIENETEGGGDDDDDDGEVDDNGDDNGGVEIDDDDNDNGDDGEDNDSIRIDGVTVNGDVSNIKHLTGKTCFLKQSYKQVKK